MEGTDLLLSECLGGTGSLHERSPIGSSSGLVHVDQVILPRWTFLFCHGPIDTVAKFASEITTGVFSSAIAHDGGPTGVGGRLEGCLQKDPMWICCDGTTVDWRFVIFLRIKVKPMNRRICRLAKKVANVNFFDSGLV
jgi:hypothetical protein